METTAIWNEFSDSLTRFIYSRVKNHEITQDLLQEVFIKIHLNIDKIKKRERLKSWVFTITNNVIIDYFKKQTIKQSQLLEKFESEDANTSEHPAEDCILPLIHNLPPTYKEAMLLSEVKGLKQAKVAEILQISLSGAKSRIQRGRNLVKQGFIDCCDYKLNEVGYLIGEHKDKENCKVCNPKT
jgi:RNA polymerase sigma-70 factor (ECF subfamily)